MVRLDLAAVLLAATSVARAVTPDTPPVVPGAYIVEYAEDQVGLTLTRILVDGRG
jgi:hypothetical protein